MCKLFNIIKCKLLKSHECVQIENKLVIDDSELLYDYNSIISPHAIIIPVSNNKYILNIDGEKKDMVYTSVRDAYYSAIREFETL